MTIQIIKDYKDKELGRWVLNGEKLQATEVRGKQIIAAGYAKDISKEAAGKDSEA